MPDRMHCPICSRSCDCSLAATILRRSHGCHESSLPNSIMHADVEAVAATQVIEDVVHDDPPAYIDELVADL